jgi:hypothetical protein
MCRPVALSIDESQFFAEQTRRILQNSGFHTLTLRSARHAYLASYHRKWSPGLTKERHVFRVKRVGLVMSLDQLYSSFAARTTALLNRSSGRKRWKREMIVLNERVERDVGIGYSPEHRAGPSSLPQEFEIDDRSSCIR